MRRRRRHRQRAPGQSAPAPDDATANTTQRRSVTIHPTKASRARKWGNNIFGRVAPFGLLLLICLTGENGEGDGNNNLAHSASLSPTTGDGISGAEGGLGEPMINGVEIAVSETLDLPLSSIPIPIAISSSSTDYLCADITLCPDDARRRRQRPLQTRTTPLARTFQADREPSQLQQRQQQQPRHHPSAPLESRRKRAQSNGGRRQPFARMALVQAPSKAPPPQAQALHAAPVNDTQVDQQRQQQPTDGSGAGTAAGEAETAATATMAPKTNADHSTHSLVGNATLEVGKQLEQRFKAGRAISDQAYHTLLIVYLTLIAFGTLGNGLICLTVLLKPKILSPRNIFIVNLAASDLLLCAFTMPFTFIQISMNIWQFGKALCKLVASLQATSLFVSTISITAIALDRYKVIVYPTHQETANGNRGAALLLISVWIGALLLAMPMFSVRQLERANVSMKNETAEYLDFCVETWPIEHGRAVYSAVVMIFQYVLPITIVSIVYAKISDKLQKRLIRRQNTTQLECQQKRQLNLIKRTHTMLIGVSLIFGLSWLPINLLNVIGDFDPDIFKYNDEYFRLTFAICHLIACSSACSNPILYGFLNENFRKEVIQVYEQKAEVCYRFLRHSWRRSLRMILRLRQYDTCCRRCCLLVWSSSSNSKSSVNQCQADQQLYNTSSSRLDLKAATITTMNDVAATTMAPGDKVVIRQQQAAINRPAARASSNAAMFDCCCTIVETDDDDDDNVAGNECGDVDEDDYQDEEEDEYEDEYEDSDDEDGESQKSLGDSKRYCQISDQSRKSQRREGSDERGEDRNAQDQNENNVSRDHHAGQIDDTGGGRHASGSDMSQLIGSDNINNNISLMSSLSSRANIPAAWKRQLLRRSLSGSRAGIYAVSADGGVEDADDDGGGVAGASTLDEMQPRRPRRCCPSWRRSLADLFDVHDDNGNRASSNLFKAKLETMAHANDDAPCSAYPLGDGQYAADSHAHSCFQLGPMDVSGTPDDTHLGSNNNVSSYAPGSVQKSKSSNDNNNANINDQQRTVIEMHEDGGIKTMTMQDAASAGANRNKTRNKKQIVIGSHLPEAIGDCAPLDQQNSISITNEQVIVVADQQRRYPSELHQHDKQQTRPNLIERLGRWLGWSEAALCQPISKPVAETAAAGRGTPAGERGGVYVSEDSPVVGGAQTLRSPGSPATKRRRRRPSTAVAPFDCDCKCHLANPGASTGTGVRVSLVADLAHELIRRLSGPNSATTDNNDFGANNGEGMGNDNGADSNQITIEQVSVLDDGMGNGNNGKQSLGSGGAVNENADDRVVSCKAAARTTESKSAGSKSHCLGRRVLLRCLTAATAATGAATNCRSKDDIDIDFDVDRPGAGTGREAAPAPIAPSCSGDRLKEQQRKVSTQFSGGQSWRRQQQQQTHCSFCKHNKQTIEQQQQQRLRQGRPKRRRRRRKRQQARPASDREQDVVEQRDGDRKWSKTGPVGRTNMKSRAESPLQAARRQQVTQSADRGGGRGILHVVPTTVAATATMSTTQIVDTGKLLLTTTPATSSPGGQAGSMVVVSAANFSISAGEPPEDSPEQEEDEEEEAGGDTDGGHNDDKRDRSAAGGRSRSRSRGRGSGGSGRKGKGRGDKAAGSKRRQMPVVGKFYLSIDNGGGRRLSLGDDASSTFTRDKSTSVIVMAAEELSGGGGGELDAQKPSEPEAEQSNNVSESNANQASSAAEPSTTVAASVTSTTDTCAQAATSPDVRSLPIAGKQREQQQQHFVVVQPATSAAVAPQQPRSPPQNRLSPASSVCTCSVGHSLTTLLTATHSSTASSLASSNIPTTNNSIGGALPESTTAASAAAGASVQVTVSTTTTTATATTTNNSGSASRRSSRSSSLSSASPASSATMSTTFSSGPSSSSAASVTSATPGSSSSPASSSSSDSSSSSSSSSSASATASRSPSLSRASSASSRAPGTAKMQSKRCDQRVGQVNAAALYAPQQSSSSLTNMYELGPRHAYSKLHQHQQLKCFSILRLNRTPPTLMQSRRAPLISRSSRALDLAAPPTPATTTTTTTSCNSMDDDNNNNNNNHRLHHSNSFELISLRKLSDADSNHRSDQWQVVQKAATATSNNLIVYSRVQQAAAAADWATPT